MNDQFSRSGLLSVESAKASTWSNLQDQTYGFAKDHAGELLAAAALAITGAGLWRVGSRIIAAKGAAGLAGAWEGTLLDAAAGSKGFAAATERAGLGQLPDTVISGAIESKLSNRTGAQLLDSFIGNGSPKTERFVDVMKSMNGVEIPRFAEEFASRHPGIAPISIGSILDKTQMAPGTEKLWASALENISQAKSARTGEQLVKQFVADGTKTGAHFADTMRGMTATEVPRFTREYTELVPNNAAGNVRFILDRAEMRVGTEDIWQKALANMQR